MELKTCGVMLRLNFIKAPENRTSRYSLQCVYAMPLNFNNNDCKFEITKNER